MSFQEVVANKRNELRTVGLAILVVAVIAVCCVIYGVITHKEGGLLQVCWENSHASYTEDLQGEGESKQCKLPMPLVWPDKQLPLSVVVFGGDHVALKEQERGSKIVRDAMDDFNLQVGKILFSIAKIVDEEPDVVVIWGVPSIVGDTGVGSRKVGGYVNHAKIGATMQAIVRIRETSSDRLAFVTTLHELGHVVALAHDQQLSSLMYPRMITDALNTATTRLTDSDVSLLRSLYFSE